MPATETCPIGTLTKDRMWLQIYKVATWLCVLRQGGWGGGGGGRGKMPATETCQKCTLTKDRMWLQVCKVATCLCVVGQWGGKGGGGCGKMPAIETCQKCTLTKDRMWLQVYSIKWLHSCVHIYIERERGGARERERERGGGGGRERYQPQKHTQSAHQPKAKCDFRSIKWLHGCVIIHNTYMGNTTTVLPWTLDSCWGTKKFLCSHKQLKCKSMQHWVSVHNMQYRDIHCHIYCCQDKSLVSRWIGLHV